MQVNCIHNYVLLYELTKYPMTGDNTAKQRGEAPIIIEVVIAVLPLFFACILVTVQAEM